VLIFFEDFDVVDFLFDLLAGCEVFLAVFLDDVPPIFFEAADFFLFTFLVTFFLVPFLETLGVLSLSLVPRPVVD
jgi:hypothetical protein